METLSVPFLCQWDLKPQDEPSAAACRAAGVTPPSLGWAARSCGIACLAMVLNFWGKDAGMGVLLRQAVETGAWDGQHNWRHTQLVGLLARHHLVACRRNWHLLDGREREYLDNRRPDSDTSAELGCVRHQMIEEGLYTLAPIVASGRPGITPAYRQAWALSSPGPLILLGC